MFFPLIQINLSKKKKSNLITKKLISNTKKYFSTGINPVDRVLTQNGLKLIFYPSQRGLTRIPP
jgi:hypothetical protein